MGDQAEWDRPIESGNPRVRSWKRYYSQLLGLRLAKEFLRSYAFQKCPLAKFSSYTPLVRNCFQEFPLRLRMQLQQLGSLLSCGFSLQPGTVDPALPQLWLRFSAWPWNFHIPWAWPLKKKIVSKSQSIQYIIFISKCRIDLSYIFFIGILKLTHRKIENSIYDYDINFINKMNGVYLFIYLLAFCLFQGRFPWHMEVPKLGV